MAEALQTKGFSCTVKKKEQSRANSSFMGVLRACRLRITWNISFQIQTTFPVGVTQAISGIVRSCRAWTLTPQGSIISFGKQNAHSGSKHSGNVNRCSHHGKQHGGPSKVKSRANILSSNPTLEDSYEKGSAAMRNKVSSQCYIKII